MRHYTGVFLYLNTVAAWVPHCGWIFQPVNDPSHAIQWSNFLDLPTVVWMKQHCVLIMCLPLRCCVSWYPRCFSLWAVVLQYHYDYCSSLFTFICKKQTKSPKCELWCDPTLMSYSKSSVFSRYFCGKIFGPIYKREKWFVAINVSHLQTSDPNRTLYGWAVFLGFYSTGLLSPPGPTEDQVWMLSEKFQSSPQSIRAVEDWHSSRRIEITSEEVMLQK